MPGVSGGDLKIALKRGATWGTAVACGVGNGFLFLPTGIKRDADLQVDDSLGSFFTTGGTPGAIKVDGDIPAYLRFDSLDVLIACFMGIAGAPAQQGATAAYKNTYKFKKDLDGIFCTIAKSMKNYIEEVPSAKIVGLTLKGERGKAIQIIAKIIGIDKTPSSVVNTVGTFANVTIGELENRVQFSQGVFRINAQGGAALASPADNIYPSSFELTMTRKLKGEYTGQYVTTGSNPQDLIDEPTNDGGPEIALKLTFPRHTSATWLTDLAADNRKKMDITFTGGLISAPYYRTFGITLSHLQLKGVAPTDEQGNISEPVEFIAHAASAAPAGMVGQTDPIWISVTNTRTTDPLA